jgi:hypothetical protein
MWFGLGVDDGGGVRFHFQDRQHAHRMGHMHGTRWHNKSILATSSKSARKKMRVLQMGGADVWVAWSGSVGAWEGRGGSGGRWGSVADCACAASPFEGSLVASTDDAACTIAK